MHIITEVASILFCHGSAVPCIALSHNDPSLKLLNNHGNFRQPWCTFTFYIKPLFHYYLLWQKHLFHEYHCIVFIIPYCFIFTPNGKACCAWLLIRLAMIVPLFFFPVFHGNQEDFKNTVHGYQYGRMYWDVLLLMSALTTGLSNRKWHIGYRYRQYYFMVHIFIFICTCTFIIFLLMHFISGSPSRYLHFNNYRLTFRGLLT